LYEATQQWFCVGTKLGLQIFLKASNRRFDKRVQHYLGVEAYGLLVGLELGLLQLGLQQPLDPLQLDQLLVDPEGVDETPAATDATEATEATVVAESPEAPEATETTHHQTHQELRRVHPELVPSQQLPPKDPT
jgi:hypothetical protein